MTHEERMEKLDKYITRFYRVYGIDAGSIRKYLEDISKLIECDDMGAYHKLFNTAHAYLQGLQDAGRITQKDHEDIFCIVMGIA